MMSRFIFTLAPVLAMAVLAGCATPRTQQITPTMKLIDAPGGDYLRFSEKLDGAARGVPQAMRVIMTARRLQPKDEWNPTINFCIEHKQTGASHCLQTYAARDGSRLIAKTISLDEKGAAPVTTDLPFDLMPSDEHYLDIVFWEDRLVMIIDDRQIMDRPLQAAPDEYWYSCSSVVCSIDVLYPYAPKR